MSEAADAQIVVLPTDVWSAIYIRRDVPESVRLWRDLLVGRTVVISTQTRAEVLSGIAVYRLVMDCSGR